MLVGRELELRALLDALETRRGVALVGEAGIGKTTLLRHVAQSLHGWVREGRCLRALSFVSYLPVVHALGSTPPAGDAAGAALWVSRQLQGATLVLDDLHWADPETLAVVPLLAARGSLLVAIRTGDPGANAAVDAVAAAGAEIVWLSGLRADDAHELVRRRQPTLTDSERSRVVALAEGNPLYLEELSPAGGASDSLAGSLRSRLSRCSPSARAAMVSLALLGRDVEQDLLPTEVVVDELVAAGLVLRTASDRFRVRHPLLAEAALEALDDGEHEALHARLARAVEDPGEAARHYQLAGELDRAREHALEAARLAIKPGDRARHLAVAAECCRGRKWNELRLDAAQELVESDPRRAGAIAALARGGNTEQQARALLVRARAAIAEGRFRMAARRCDRGLELVSRRKLGVEVELRALRSELLLADERTTAQAIRNSRAAWRLAQETGEHRALARWALGAALWWGRDSPASIPHLQAALEDAREGDDVALECRIVVNLHSAEIAFGDPDRGHELAEQAAERARMNGLRAWELQLRWMASRARMFAHGRYDEARAELAELLDDPGFSYPYRTTASGDLAFALAALGRTREAFAAVESQSRGHYQYGDEALLEMEWETAWLAGDGDRSLDVARRFLDVRHSRMRPAAIAMHGWSLLDLGRTPPPVRHVRPVSRLQAHYLREAEGLWQLGRGRPLEAERLLLSAARAHRPAYLHLELRALLGASIAASQAGEVRRARRRLLAIEERAHAAGLEPMLARVHRALRNLGMPRPARRFGRAHGSITSREMEVLGLVAEGQTSRLIGARLGIAPATVDSLVRTATTKLGVRRRRQAAAIMSDVLPRRLLAIAENDVAAGVLMEAVREEGAELRAGWLLPAVPWIVEGIACVGSVRTDDDVRNALLAAARGAHVVVEGPIPGGLRDEFVEDLGRLGPVVVRRSEPVDRLRPNERGLLELVAGGLSVREAARELHVSRRSADRLFASARRVLGVAENGEAVAVYVRARHMSTRLATIRRSRASPR